MHPITALNLIHRAQLQLAFCRRQLGILRAARDAARASTWRWRLAAAVLALALVVSLGSIAKRNYAIDRLKDDVNAWRDACSRSSAATLKWRLREGAWKRAAYRAEAADNICERQLANREPRP